MRGSEIKASTNEHFTLLINQAMKTLKCEVSSVSINYVRFRKRSVCSYEVAFSELD